MKRLIMVLLVLVLSVSVVYASELTPVEKTDRFTALENLAGEGFSMMSQDGELVIHVNSETSITAEDGSAVEGDIKEMLDGKILTVAYSFATMSIPAQTSPISIMIMEEQSLILPEADNDFDFAVLPDEAIIALPDEELVDYSIMELNGEVVVNDEIIDAPKPYIEEGKVMVPLRAVAERLGFDVFWDEAKQGVRLGVAINLWIGQDRYEIGRMMPIELGAVPVIRESSTFVPLEFFRQVLHQGAYVFEGQVVINDELELME